MIARFGLGEVLAMASGYGGGAAHQINRLFRDGTTIGLTDGQLIERFTTRRPDAAEAAFEALVTRHGPMVLRVIRGILRDPHDVEDAFQATFLILVQKAHSIGERDLLGPWLYGVANRVALKARSLAARRNMREGGLVDDPPGEVAEGFGFDLRPILHEELNRLPDKYKKPVVLCHLQGLTHAEAAQELAWPVGTVSVRLTRARKLLKDRLTRRGLTVTATLWASGLMAEGATAAVVPQALIQSTARAAFAALTGKLLATGGISTGAILLTKRTLTMMLMSRLKWMIVPLMLGAGTTGAVILAQESTERNPKAQARDDSQASATGTKLSKKPQGVGSPPAGYFDFPSRVPKEGKVPTPIIQPGQLLNIEVLETLPGRPIAGEYYVRTDGTITLGFYGDLKVAGLNRTEVKIKLIEHLRKYLSDDVLGLIASDPNDPQPKYLPPAESNRVYVSDDASFDWKYAADRVDTGKAQEGQVITVEALVALPGRPITGQRVVGPDGMINLGFYGDVYVLGLSREQIKVKVIEHLRKYMNDEALGLIEVDKAGNNKVVLPAESSRIFIDDAILPSGPSTAEAVNQLRNQVNGLNVKLDRVIKELEALRGAARPVEPQAKPPG